jgi:hypothetical protein
MTDVYEPYVDRQELVALLGVSLSTIKRWHHEDPPVPSESWGMRRHFYQPSRVVVWARARADRMNMTAPLVLDHRGTNRR